jgi:hypothetical protein
MERQTLLTRDKQEAIALFDRCLESPELIYISVQNVEGAYDIEAAPFTVTVSCGDDSPDLETLVAADPKLEAYLRERCPGIFPLSE